MSLNTKLIWGFTCVYMCVWVLVLLESGFIIFKLPGTCDAVLISAHRVINFHLKIFRF